MNNETREPTPPQHRLTITSGRIDLERWYPSLAQVAPGSPALRDAAERGVFLADVHQLTDEDDERREISVTPLDPDTAIPEFVIDALLPWAAAVGHHRVWLPDRMLEIESDGVPAGSARVTCGTCGSRWSDSDEDFFAMVRRWGQFPSACWMCGRSLSQWTIDGTQQTMFDPEAAA